ncbi:MAG: diphthine synthase [Candidatus Nanoarchaeia archaeon]
MLHIIGIGTKKEHITEEMKSLISNSHHVFLEHYTNFYENSFEELEQYINTSLQVCTRENIESQVEELILKPAKNEDTALLIIGDCLIATTHTDLLLRAKELEVDVKLYHNVSVANLITRTGLQWYKFGKVTSIPFFNEKFMPRTPFMNFIDNQNIGAHSLFLLDLNPSNDIAYKGKEKYLKAHNALEFLLKIPQIMQEEEEIEEKDAAIIDEQTSALICSRLGMGDEKILFGTIQELIEKDSKHPLPEPLCIIIPSEMHDIEEEFVKQFQI